MTTQNCDHDLAPIIANLQWQLENYEDLHQISKTADENSKNGQILLDECKELINKYEVAEDKVSLWC